MGSPRPRVSAFPRPLLIVLLLLAGAPRLQAELNPAEIEDAAEFARKAAKAALAGPTRIFVEAVDTDAILERRLGSAAWKGLTARQREQLRSVVRDQFLQTLAPPRNVSPGEIVWSAASSDSPAGETVKVLLGLKYANQVLKTMWQIRRTGEGWRVADVVLADPGISLSQVAVRALGPQPVRRRDRRREAERAAYPRLAALAAIALVLVLATPRLGRQHRGLLAMTAAAPAVLFAIDGALAVQRTLAEPYAITPVFGPPRWRMAEQRALQAEQEGRVADARQHWSQAIAEGDPAGPVRYEMGRASRRRGDLTAAREEFEQALEEKAPAPGAAKELASMDVEAANFDQAERDLERYVELAGEDPETLSLLAVVRTRLGKTEAALEALRRARALVGEEWRGARLEAQVLAHAGDAAGAVAVLRPLDADGRIDREVLRADPAFLPIATDPAWVAFLNEKPARKP